MSPGDDLDVRGTVLSDELLGQILGALTDLPGGRARIRSGQFDLARFSGDAEFGGAAFSGDVSFAAVIFDGYARFKETTFDRSAVFIGTSFNSIALFEKAQFGGGAGFESAQFGDAAFFNGAQFSSGADFDRAKFTELAAFGAAEFDRSARFKFAEFGRLAVFDGAKFASDAVFDAATFRHYAHFDEAIFSGEAKFGGMLGGARFSRDVQFEGAKFRQDANFDRVEFRGDAWFSRATFDADAQFASVLLEGSLLLGPSVICGALTLSGMQARSVVRIVAAVKRVGCSGGDFGGRVWLTLQGGELWLVDSVFKGPVTVESALEPVWPVAEPIPRTPESGWRVALRSLRGTDAEHLTLVDVDLGRCVLLGLRRPELLRLDGRCVFAPVPSGWCRRWGWVPWRWMAREALFEEHVWRRSLGGEGQGAGWGIPSDADDGGTAGVAVPARLAVLYRQLRAAVEDARNEPGTADLYYGEMEMRRLGADRRGERWLLSAYWLVSGYGLRAWRALAVLTSLVLASAWVLERGGFARAAPSLPDCVLYAAGSVVSLDVIVRHVPDVLTSLGEAVRLVLRVGGPLLLGLAALAVRGRVKR